MDIVVICAFSVISVFVCKSIENDVREIKLLIVITAAVIIFCRTAGSLNAVIAEIRSLFAQGDTDPQYVKILLKSLGICYITDFAVGVCRDSGENTLASQTQLAGKAALLITALPMLEALIGVIKTLLV